MPSHIPGPFFRETSTMHERREGPRMIRFLFAYALLFSLCLIGLTAALAHADGVYAAVDRVNAETQLGASYRTAGVR